LWQTAGLAEVGLADFADAFSSRFLPAFLDFMGAHPAQRLRAGQSKGVDFYSRLTVLSMSLEGREGRERGKLS
jgi:hypothetical protein